jgi:8-oxo-dGTP diphosphatase
MYLNSEENANFKGTGELNADGLTLDAFCEAYDPKKYDNPCNTVDNLIFSYAEDNGRKKITKVLLIKRKNHPSIGWWALPGGFVDFREDIDVAAARELQEETGIEGLELEQLKTYGDPKRDPRTRIITTAFVALVPEGAVKEEAGDDAKDAGWFSISTDSLGNFEENGRHFEDIVLTLTNDEKGVTTSKIRVSYRTGAVLKDERYEVLETKGLAADHPAVVLEGYRYVKALMD